MIDAPECLVRQMAVIGGRSKNIDTFLEVGAGFSTSQDDLGKTKRSLGLGAAYLVSS
jgi:hypothetical protein